MSASIAMIEHVAHHLGELSQEVVFVGGTVVRLLVTDPAFAEFRTTGDVDVIVETASRGVFAEFEDRLREISGTLVDVMSTDVGCCGPRH